MKIKSLVLVFSISFPLFIFSCLISSCQTAKKAEDAEQENTTEKLAQLLQKHKQDSIQNAFCDCLVEDSISREEQLKNIDNFLSQKVDINFPCAFEEEVNSNVAETALINMGVAISNRILRTKFRKRQTKTNTILKSYPILMLFNEDTSMIAQLVSRGANLDIKTKDIVSLPEYYISQNELQNLQFCLDLGAKAEEMRIFTSNEKMIEILIEKGAKTENIDKITLFESDNYKKVAEKYKIDLSKVTCIEFNQIIQIKKFSKINFERTEWLLANGVSSSCINSYFLENVIDENFDGRIFSTRTKRKPNQHTRKEWIEMLGKYDVNWNQCTSFGKNPLILAVEKHDKELIQMLLNQSADINFACNFAGQKKTAKDILEKEIKYAEENELRKKERKQENYSKKEANKHADYMKKLDEIKVLLEQK
ncbi:hypothetical protein [Bernardetia sp. MNP-M8]|uniref:hypothetical protein n=1 Tax=Bernardetia sp. MNP-M8 TaxID=3127470 RepID=UPI0030D2A807